MSIDLDQVIAQAAEENAQRQQYLDVLGLLQRAYNILADQDYDDDSCRLLSDIERITGIGMDNREDSDVDSR